MGVINSIEVSDSRGDKEIVVNTNDQGNGFVENVVPGNNLSADGTFISAPLRLNGGGDASFESGEEIFGSQGNCLLENTVSDANCSNDILSFINQDSSMSEMFFLRPVIRLMQ